MTDEKAGTTSPTSGEPSDNDIIINNLVHGLDIDAATNTDYSVYFVSYAAGDLHLIAGSPAINAGTTTNAPTIDQPVKSRVKGRAAA